MSETVRQGGCGCGALRYEVTGEPIFVNNCHCRQCQHQTGSTSVVNAFFEAERLAITSGEVSEHTVTAGSGGEHLLMRCAACGTAYASHYPGFGRLGLGLRVGTLDDAGAFRPDAVIFASEAMPWVAFPEDIPRFETTYRYSEVLTPENMERFKALLAKKQQ